MGRPSSIIEAKTSSVVNAIIWRTINDVQLFDQLKELNVQIDQYFFSAII
jgi:hypothetical protein